LPDELPPFLHGFHRGSEIWVYEQSGDYYRRHLLLHEGTHAFMKQFLGGAGPPWYMEGVAELLGTHRWADGRLQLGHFPRDRDEAPYWGRVKIVRDEVDAGRPLSLVQVMKFDSQAHLRNEPYGWSWAAAAFFDGHPRYQAAFRQAQRDAANMSEFNSLFYTRLRSEWPLVEEQWRIFLADLDYGYDVARGATAFPNSSPPSPAGAATTIAVDRGWQSTGVVLEAGQTYRLQATGRYQIGDRPAIWWCEPPGVTIEYRQGKPLGMVLAAVRNPQSPPQGISPWNAPAPVGAGGELTPSETGTLFLRIDEDVGRMADNAGEVQVRIEPLSN
jgi:hypothetical protein